MARQKMCPDGGEEKKKKKMHKEKDDKDKQHGEGRSRSNHAGDSIGNFETDMMAASITEINY